MTAPAPRPPVPSWAGPVGRPRRRRAGRAALAAVLGALLLLGACGLPSRTDPKYAGPAQSAAPVQQEVKAPTPDFTAPAQGLVSQFLRASVGGNLDVDAEGTAANNETRDRLRQWLTPEAAKLWKPKPGLTIVRDMEIHQNDDGNGHYTVSVNLDPVGALGDRGDISRPTVPESTFEFKLETSAGGQLRISSAPPDLYLTVSGLKDWYDWQPIYFWELGAEHSSRLVPDLRYMPRTLSPTKRVSEALSWLKQGPSQWLLGVAAGWPTTVEVKDNPVLDNEGVRVNLSGKAAGLSPDELDRLVRQIRWSLSPDYPPVHLTIESQSNGADSSNFLNDNATYAQATATPNPEKFCVAGGSARSVAIPLNSADIPLFAPGGANTGVVSAAVNRTLSTAALVRQAGKERQLWVSSSVLPMATPPKYDNTGVHGTALSRPAFVNLPSPRLLISDGNVLWASTDEKGQKFEPVQTTQLQAAPITAFAVAPEGRRIALVVGGTVMVAALQMDNGKLSIGGPVVPIDTSLGDNQSVGWLTETVLVVGGKPSAAASPYSLVGVTVDGAEENPLPLGVNRAPSEEVVTEVVSHPSSPQETTSWQRMPFSVMVETNSGTTGVAREVFRDSLGAVSLSGNAPGAPSAPPTPATAPFYAE